MMRFHFEPRPGGGAARPFLSGGDKVTSVITIEATALAYAKRGWKPVPIGRKTKKAIGKKWQERSFDPAQFNGNSQNVGLQMGAASAGLCDVDLDTTLAIGLALEFLPKTEAVFGRKSKPASHMLYVSDLHQN